MTLTITTNTGTMPTPTVVTPTALATKVREIGGANPELALFFYGSAAKWKAIYDANRSVIGANPNLIRVGQRLTIPKTP